MQLQKTVSTHLYGIDKYRKITLHYSLTLNHMKQKWLSFTHTCTFSHNHDYFQWHSATANPGFKATVLFKGEYLRNGIEPRLPHDTNRKLTAGDQMQQVSVTLSMPNPDFKVGVFFQIECQKWCKIERQQLLTFIRSLIRSIKWVSFPTTSNDP